MRAVCAAFAVLVVVGSTVLVSSTAQAADPSSVVAAVPIQSLDGSGNNVANPTWGKADTTYPRIGPTRYADGIGAQVPGPDARYVSNRTFNDVNQNLFAEGRVTQWGFVWGQFMDHVFSLRLGRAPDDPVGEQVPIPFDRNDPLEEFTNVNTNIPFERSARAAGTGVTTPREQVNTVDSYIDASNVYGNTVDRLEWMREGPVDGNMANNGARLFLPGGFLPLRESRGNAATAPVMEVEGHLRRTPNRARVAGDVRANENIGLQATHNLFAREHNRLVSLLPNVLTDEQKFQIARRVVIAEMQHITYTEFLPAMGVRLPRYTGYKPNVNASILNEFATIGYRAHSMIHGEFELEADADRYSAADFAFFEQQGVEVVREDGSDEIELVVPLNVAFFNPDLLNRLQLGPMLQGIGLEAQYKNDEQIDNQLRSVLFQIPVPGNPECLDGPTLPECFRSVVDLGAVDIQRARDHGLPTYNQLRRAYGLAPKTSFRAITGEASEAFPADPQLTPGNEVNDPDSVDFTALFDRNGAPIALDSPAAESDPIEGTRRTSAASRLRAIYRTVDQVDAFVGMIAEPHLPGREFGELQLAIWTKQYAALRDGDRFFYGNDPGLSEIQRLLGINFRVSLRDVIARNTDIPADEMNANVFLTAEAEHDPGRVLGIGSQLCLDVPGSSTSNGTQLQIWECNETEAQQWTQLTTRQLQVVVGGKCVETRNHGTGNGTPVVIWDCHPGVSQHWTFNRDGRIVHVQSGKCLDVDAASVDPGGKLQIWPCHGRPNQKWIR